MNTEIKRMTLAKSVLLLSVLAALSGNALAQKPTPTSRPVQAESGDAETEMFRPFIYNGPPVATPRLSDGKPDLSGFWQGAREKGVPGGNHGKDQPGFILPLSEKGKRAMIYSQNHAPDPEAVCINGGIPRHNSSGLPFEILQTADRFSTLYHYTTHRSATVGAKRALPSKEQVTKTYFGTNVAYWDGDTLVIETTGLRDSSFEKIWLDENGNPTSDQTTVVERWSRPDYHHLQLEETVTDLKYYRTPFKFTRKWNYGGDGRGVGEYSCNENNVEREHIGPGAGVIGPDGGRGFGYNAPLPKTPPGPDAYDL
jgi:hypothetical protein